MPIQRGVWSPFRGSLWWDLPRKRRPNESAHLHDIPQWCFWVWRGLHKLSPIWDQGSHPQYPPRARTLCDIQTDGARALLPWGNQGDEWAQIHPPNWYHVWCHHTQEVARSRIISNLHFLHVYCYSLRSWLNSVCYTHINVYVYDIAQNLLLFSCI